MSMRLGRLTSLVATQAARPTRRPAQLLLGTVVVPRWTIRASSTTTGTNPGLLVSSWSSMTTTANRTTTTPAKPQTRATTTHERHLSSHSDNNNHHHQQHEKNQNPKSVEFQVHVPHKDKNPRPKLDPSRYRQKIPVRMPDMGEGKGKVLKWYKKEGDVILREDALCDIETPDFVFGLETDDEHPTIMGEILVEAPSGEVDDDEILCYLMHPSEEEEEKNKKGDDTEEGK
eukprot:scaffold42590_cov206-Amphora_coffeaeformis.AAC.1